MQALTDSYVSEDEGQSWTTITYPTPFVQIEMAADLVTNADGSAVLVISGGIDFISYTSFNSIYQSVDRGQSFQVVTAAAAWPVRHGHEMVTVSMGQTTEKLVVLGGYSMHGTYNSLTYLNDIWVSSDMGVSWTSLGQAPWAGRGDAGVVVNDRDQVFVMGGAGRQGSLNDGQFSQAVERDIGCATAHVAHLRFLSSFDLFVSACSPPFRSLLSSRPPVWMARGDNINGANGWTQMSAAAPWQPRWGAVVESFNNTLVLISGDVSDSITSQEVKSNHVWLSWDNGAGWTRVTNLTFAGRSDAVAEVIDEYLYIAGGETYGQNRRAIAMSEIWSTWVQYNTPVEPPTPEPVPESGKVPFSEWSLVQQNAWTPRASAVSAYFPSEGSLIPGRWLIVGPYRC